MSQADANEQADNGGIMSRFFSKFKKSDLKDDDKAAMQSAASRRKSIVRFSEISLKGPGVANQLKSIKDADAASAARKAKEADERRKRESGQVEEVNTQILPADIDRWMPDHWLRSQYVTLSHHCIIVTI
jgi:hypothetical protein